MRSLKDFNIGVSNLQSVQAYEHDGIQESGYVFINACRHWIIRSSKQVYKWECYHQSNDKCELPINKACEYTSM